MLANTRQQRPRQQHPIGGHRRDHAFLAAGAQQSRELGVQQWFAAADPERVKPLSGRFGQQNSQHLDRQLRALCGSGL
jgi:hypothetical protein